MRATFLTIGATLLFATAAFADQTQTSAPAQTASASNSNRIVCHYMVHEGSLLTHATQCRTQRWWDSVRKQQEQMIDDYQLHSYSAPMR